MSEGEGGDAANFILSLVDRVTGPGRDAAKAIDDINKKLKDTARFSKLTGEEFTHLGMHKFTEGYDHAVGSMLNTAKYAALGLTTLGVAAGTYVVEGVVSMGIFADASRRAFSSLLGDGERGNAVFADTVALAKSLGLEVQTTTHAMQKFLAMQISPEDAKRYIKLTADLKSVGVTDEAMGRVMMDIAHIKGTGKLNMRELRTFAMAGVSTELIMDEVAKAMGLKGSAEAYEAMHKGKVTSQIALPAMERAIMHKTHESAPGEAGTKYANESLGGLLTQLKNAPGNLFLRVAEMANQEIQSFKPIIADIVKMFDNIKGEDLQHFVENVLETVKMAVPLIKEFAAGFGEGFDEFVKEMRPASAALGDLKTDNLQLARDLGRDLAHFFTDVLKTIKAVIGFIHELPTGTLKWSLIIGGVLTTLLRLYETFKGVQAIALALDLGKLLGAGAGVQALGAGAGGAANLVLPGAGLAAPALEGAAESLAPAVGLEVGAAVEGAAVVAGEAVAITLGAALAATAGSVIAGLGIGYIFREEIAKWLMAPREDQATHRGLDASDMVVPAPGMTPTPLLAATQAAAGQSNTNSNVRVDNINVSVNADGKDAAALGKAAGEGAHDGVVAAHHEISGGG